MAVNWTPEQTEAIETRGGNILVAAAAGSGKTAVLVERVIRMICDTKNPVPVDKLLVLTFTDAAAGEMKRKIADAIDLKLAENPEDEWLREQSIKVNSACISTIHSFCSRIIANNAHLTDLPSDYTLIDETENEILCSNALDEVLEAYYKRIDKKHGFRELVLGSGVQSDRNLREMIIKIYNFSQSLAYPKRWFRRVCSDMYCGIETREDLAGSAWFEPIKRELCSLAYNLSDAIRHLVELTVSAELPRDNPHYIYYHDLKYAFCDVYDNIDTNTAEGFDALCRLLNEFSLPKAPRASKAVADIKSELDFYRKEITEASLASAKSLLAAFDDDSLHRLTKSAPTVRTLCNIVRMTERVHRRLKRERSAIDFSDLEHEMLKLLCGTHGNETPLCVRLRENYCEILVDEFQDTNALQFEIFSHLSKADGNLFMVGDVKQSIYKFRNADPSIFLRLYKDYGSGRGGRLIRLFKNFRSRREVIDSVNHIFSAVMSERVGGIDYTEDEYLIPGAVYEDGGDYRTEIIINDASDISENPITHVKIEPHDLESAYAAARIKRLVTGGELCVTDKDSGRLRPVRYGDIAVLSAGWDDCLCMEEALSNEGISAFCEKSSHYLDSIEVATVLAFLQIIDNPIQDIPLLAVLRSPLFGFSANELAEIRTAAEGRYYFALTAAAENTPKAAEFLEVLNNLRNCSKYMGVDELVWKICYELDYISIVGSMEDGGIRKANLKLLLKRCSDFEQGVLTGLFNFIKYIEKLREGEKDLSPAAAAADSADTVTVMTIHKSKGLEFPVVLLFGLDRRINTQDASNRIIWDAELGLGMDFVDTRQRILYRMPEKELISAEIRRGLYAERMRLLYVAMTRAKEKLIISASQGARYSEWKKAVFNPDGTMHPAMVEKMSSMRDWIWGSVMNHPDGKPLREFGERLDLVPSCKTDASYTVYLADAEAEAETSTNTVYTANTAEAAENTDALCEMLDYVYPFSEEGRLPVKISVSELKRRQMPEEDFSAGLIKAERGLIYSTDEISAAERGTVTHYVMQHIDISRTDSAEAVTEQIDAMAAGGMITEAQRLAVNDSAIFGFFDSDLGKRLKAARQFEREFDFYMQVSAEEIGSRADGKVLVQGIADCFFEEDGELVLIDYKTDRVSSEKCAARAEMYRVQMNYYSKGLSDVLGKRVKERYIYFLNCSTVVAC